MEEEKTSDAAKAKEIDSQVPEEVIKSTTGTEAVKEPEDGQITFFKSSDYKVPPQLTDYLKKHTTGIAYNKYCIDCKVNKSTHFIVWTGTFVCAKCSMIHKTLTGNSMRNCYVKPIFENEHWDDYQLKSMQVGGNKELFDMMKEYDLLESPVREKYQHRAVVWYFKRHAARIEESELQFEMENPKPPLNKDDEKTNWSIKAQTIALKTGSTLSRGAEDASRKITDHSLYYADKVDEKFN